uniref:Uncharacterized protein n=1 Tax=Glossina palpalis gambiensis TaxID=67801 RepID=A0A1B0AQ04_9MUSC
MGIALNYTIASEIYRVKRPNQDIRCYVLFPTESRNHGTTYAGDAKSQSQANERLMPLKATTILLWSHFDNAYTNIKLLQSSLWYAMVLCDYLQVISYIEVLWKDIKPDSSIACNGAVNVMLPALSAIFALGADYMHTRLLKPCIIILAVLLSLEPFCYAVEAITPSFPTTKAEMFGLDCSVLGPGLLFLNQYFMITLVHPNLGYSELNAILCASLFGNLCSLTYTLIYHAIATTHCGQSRH